MEEQAVDPCVRIRGLPFSAREEDVIEFFEGLPVKGGKEGITFTFGRDGRVSGEAYVLFESVEEAQKALGYNKKYMGKRYLEVFPATMKEYNFMSGRGISGDDYVLRLRGLPYDVDKQEIAGFFEGCEIAPNGIGLLLDTMGRSTGEAFVQFTSQEMLDRARAKHLQKIGHRYIEMFRSNMLEANTAIRRQMEINEGRLLQELAFAETRGFMGGGRPGPYHRPSDMLFDTPRMRGNVKAFLGGGRSMGERSTPGDDWRSTTGHSIHLRGLPFNAVEDDVFTFFAPLIPVHVEIHVSPMNGRPSGEADADFATHEEAKEAMKKDRERIGNRYIELFLNSIPSYGRETNGPNVSKGYAGPSSRHPLINDGKHFGSNLLREEQYMGGFSDGRVEGGFGAPGGRGGFHQQEAPSGYYDDMVGMGPQGQGYYMPNVRNQGGYGRGGGGRYY